jgi:hypothetical protein
MTTTATTEAAEDVELTVMFAELHEELAVLGPRLVATADEIVTERIVVTDDEVAGQDVGGYDRTGSRRSSSPISH